MKRSVFRRVVCALTTLMLSLCLAMPVCAFDVDHGYVSLSFKNAPEGTAFIDILVPIAWDTDFLTESHGYTVRKSEKFFEQVEGTGEYGMYGSYKPVEWNTVKSTSQNFFISENSEIAQYCKDGYVSLFGHTSMVKEDISIYNRYENGELKEMYFRIYLCGSEQLRDRTEKEKEVDIFYLSSNFKDMKAAYVDKDGNVLGVTDKYDIDRHDHDYIFRADGNKLTLGYYGYDYWYTLSFLLNLLLYFGVPVVMIIIVLVIFVKSIIYLKKNGI